MLGVEDFVQGQYFAGEIFVDTDKKSYSALGFKRFSWISILKAIFTSASRAMINRAKRENVKGDFKGDGLQNGGALVVQAGGNLLYSFKQDGPAEHVPNNKFLEVLGLPVESGSSNDGNEAAGNSEKTQEQTPQPECTDDVCTLPPRKK